MKFKWLIQDVGLIQSQINRKFEALDLMNENLDGIGVMANYNYISNLENVLEDDLNTVYIILGGVKVLNLLRKAKSIKDVAEFPTQFQIDNSDIILNALKNGYFYDYEKFDQAYYGKLNLPLLNQSAIYIPIKDNLKTSFNERKFIKPSRDLKAFDAGILEIGVSVEDFIMSKDRQPFFIDENLVVSDVIEMNDEFRFFVVDGEVVSGSYYRKGGIVGEHAIVPEIMFDIAKEYTAMYTPADIYTLDLARLKDGSVKIVEYNCFNCSGVYLCDLVKTYSAIKNKLNKY
jgi:hypothetical protein